MSFLTGTGASIKISRLDTVLIETKNRLVVASGRGLGGGEKWGKVVKRYILPVTK